MLIHRSPEHSNDEHPRLSAVWLLACVALGLAWYLPLPPRNFSPDSLEFLEYADCIGRSWRGGEGAVPCAGASYWPPLLPLLLALLESVGLDPVVSFRVLSLCAQALLPLPAFILGRSLAGATAGRWAAFLVVLSTALRINAGMPDARQSGLLMGMLALSAWVMWVETARQRWMWAAGALFGMAIQLRSEAQLNLLLCVLATGAFVVLRTPESTTHDSSVTARPAPVHEGTSSRSVRHRFQSAVVRLRQEALRPVLTLFASTLAISIPLQLIGRQFQAQPTFFPRAWESLIVGWMSYFPLEVFIPLFGLGDMSTPLRGAVVASLLTRPDSAPYQERIALLAQQLQLNLPQLPYHVTQALPFFTLPLGGLGFVWLLSRPQSRRPLAFWALLLVPLLALMAIPQTFNPRLPESNLLFLPFAVSVLSGAGLASLHVSGGIWWQLRQRFWRPSTAAVAPPLKTSRWQALLDFGMAWGPLLLTAGLAVDLYEVARDDYQRVLIQRGDGTFDASPMVTEAAEWMRQHSSTQARVLASLSGASVPILAERTRESFPSYWEIPSRLASLRASGLGLAQAQGHAHQHTRGHAHGPEHFLVLTSLDQMEAPLAVEMWTRIAREPGMLSLAYFGEARGQWVAILRLLPG